MPVFWQFLLLFSRRSHFPRQLKPVGITGTMDTIIAVRPAGAPIGTPAHISGSVDLVAMLARVTMLAFVGGALLLSASHASACEGCSCRGGPGYRLPTGNCVSWAQHEKHKAAGDFPSGAHCEHPQGCSLETPKGVKLLGTGTTK